MAIDPTTFDYKKSRWQDIFTHLKNKGFEVYSPGIKVGECKSPYLVVKNDGSSEMGEFSTDEDLYAILCYVPVFAYSTLEPLVQDVKKAMKDLLPMIIPAGSQTPSYLDDMVKAHMVSISYKNYKKI